MKTLPNIELSDEQISSLLNHYKITTGGEATICEGIYSYTIAKIFTKKGTIVPMSDNKKYKIIELFIRQLEHTTIPIRTISNNGILVGYEMTTDPYYDAYRRYQLSLAEQRQLLLKTKEVLEYLTNQEIIYGDIELRNILFNKENGDVMLCDMDNSQIDDHPMDLKTPKIELYDETRGRLDYGIHPFMHNYLTLRLQDLDPYNSIFTLRKVFNKQALKIIHSMKQPVNFKPEYIIQYMKK